MTVVFCEQSLREASPLNGLERLGLSAEQLDALARQGSMAAEDRGRKKPIHKLRFRLNGRQIVKYVGTDPDFVEAVRRDVMALQQEHRGARELRQLVDEAQAVRRSTKRTLQPVLEAAGMRFHGYAIRRTKARPEK